MDKKCLIFKLGFVWSVRKGFACSSLKYQQKDYFRHFLLCLISERPFASIKFDIMTKSSNSSNTLLYGLHPKKLILSNTYRSFNKVKIFLDFPHLVSLSRANFFITPKTIQNLGSLSMSFEL